MGKITKVFVSCTIPLCYLWSVSSLVSCQQISDNAIARVVNATNKEDSIWMKVVTDNTSDSGWAVDLLRNVPTSFTDANFHVYMYAKEMYKPRFRHHFFHSVLCPLVSKKTRHDKLSFDHFMPTQIMKMIFPGREASCSFKKSTRAIQSEASVNANRRDSQNENVGIPYSFPFHLMVNIIRVSESREPLDAYTFQVNFIVDLIGGDRNETNANNSKAGNDTMPQLDRPIDAPARVIGVSNGIDNPFFSAVEDGNSSIGWAIKVAKRLNRYIIDYDLWLDLYDVEPTNDTSVRRIFAGFLCDALVYNSRYNGYPEHNYFPRQIVDVIFPGHQGSCDFEARTDPIDSNGVVNLNPYDNPDVKLPRSPYYNLVANVRSKKYRNESHNVYFFQVNFTVGDLPSGVNPKINGNVKIVGKPPYYCLNTKWNYYVIWQACKSYEFIKSVVSAIERQISNLI